VGKWKKKNDEILLLSIYTVFGWTNLCGSTFQEDGLIVVDEVCLVALIWKDGLERICKIGSSLMW